MTSKIKSSKFVFVRLEIFLKNIFESLEIIIDNKIPIKKIDIAIHALKDMPAIETKGLITDCFLKRNDPREILISSQNKKLDELEKDSIIGTSSFRREFQLKKLRKDLNYKLIRGNVDTRINKLKDGKYDAILLAGAGIKSLDLENKISLTPVEPDLFWRGNLDNLPKINNSFVNPS